jgi:hypothetical protein
MAPFQSGAGRAGGGVPERFSGLAPAKKRDAEVHVDGGGWRPEGDRALEAHTRRSLVAIFAQRHPEKCVTGAG